MKLILRPLPVAAICSALLAASASLAEVETGMASYYADSLHGNKTASGEPYDKNAMTAAHRILAFGTQVIVTYPKTGKSVEVRINDRGPHVKDRIIDLSGAAAEAIGVSAVGVERVADYYSMAGEVIPRLARIQVRAGRAARKTSDA